MKYLLVEPEFPIPDKSKNHAHFLPIGLLKIATYHKNKGDAVRLVRGLVRPDITPDRVLITSLFTYWAQHVHDAADFYHAMFPAARIDVGGIYASLMYRQCKNRSPFARVCRGLYRGGVAERISPDYSLLPVEPDYQVVHTSRGCTRHCAFCGTWRIEPKFESKSSITHEIQKPRIVFYDNNLLANPNIDHILRDVAAFKLGGRRRVSCESQSGFELRLLTPARAKLLRSANFKYPRIAWDGRYSCWPKVRAAVRMLKDVGYGRKDIFVFMLYNHVLGYAEMRKKLDACRRWQVRVIDCRYRPLNATSDGYRPGPAEQPTGEYYVHPGWTDWQVRGFRRAVRHQNIAILLNLPNGRYIQGCEQRKVPV